MRTAEGTAAISVRRCGAYRSLRELIFPLSTATRATGDVRGVFGGPQPCPGDLELATLAVLTGGGNTPVVLCCVLVYTPEPTVRRLRVPDGRRRARVAHAPKAPNDEARAFAEEGGHPPPHPPRPAATCRMIL